MKAAERNDSYAFVAIAEGAVPDKIKLGFVTFY